MNKEEYLSSIYFNPEHGGSFGGVSKLYQAVQEDALQNGGIAQTISQSDVKKWLATQDTYSSMRSLKRKSKRPKVVVGGKLRQWDADSAYLESYAKQNDGYKFFVLFIDIFTRFVYTVPLKTLQGKEMVRAMTSVFEVEQPEKLRTDRGSEYANRDVSKLLRDRKIEHFTTTNETKANYAERAIQTIKMKLTRYMMEHQSHQWIHLLKDVTDSYNLTYHRSIHMTPTQAKVTSDAELWQIQHRDRPPIPKKKKSKNPPKSRSPYTFKVGDQVKLSHLKKLFDRMYDQKWTGEIFIVIHRELNQGIPLYTLKDFQDDPIEGKFYQHELQKVRVDENTVYKIEKILKTEKNRVKVRWMGWPAKFDSYISKEELKDYPHV